MPDEKNILIIDDSSVNNLLLENILTEEGYKVKVCFNAADAFAYIEKITPQLILLDIMMPGMNGYTALKKLKTLKKTRHIPVIMVSAKSDDVDIEKSKNLDAEDYIVKPININVMLEKIRNVLTPA